MSEHGDGPPASDEQPAATDVVRDLTRREREVLALLVDRAPPLDPDDVVEPADRARWRAQLPSTRAGRACECGQCPTIELTDATGAPVRSPSRRLVLQAEADEALLLLFVDDDRLSCLELAPTGDRTFAELPPPEGIRTG